MVIALVAMGSSFVHELTYAQVPGSGLRNRVGVELSAGTSDGLLAELTFPIDHFTALRIEGNFGGGIATWGMGEAWQAALSVVISAASDRVNNALLLSPGLAYGVMLGDPADQRGWIDFSPFATVHSIAVICGASWAHEYESWSLELALRPGFAYAFDGRDSKGNVFAWGSDTRNGNNALGEGSLVLSCLIIAHFW